MVWEAGLTDCTQTIVVSGSMGKDRPTEMVLIPTIVSINSFDMVAGIVSAGIGGLMQLGSSIYGSVASAKQNKEAQRELEARRAENKRWYEQKMNEDYTMRSDVQNVLRKQRELLQEQYQRARATNVVAGGTDESLALQQQAANEVMGDTMAEIAANAEAHKDAVESDYRANEAALSQQQQNIYAGQAQATAQAASQAANAGAALLGAGLEKIGETEKKKVGATTVEKEGGN